MKSIQLHLPQMGNGSRLVAKIRQSKYGMWNPPGYGIVWQHLKVRFIRLPFLQMANG